jgi:hypothetical protein
LLGRFCGQSFDRLFRIEELDVPEHIPQRALRNIVIELSCACYLHLLSIRFEFDERLGEVVVYLNRVSVLCVIYCLTTECGELHAPIVEYAVLSMGEDGVGHRQTRSYL